MDSFTADLIKASIIGFLFLVHMKLIGSKLDRLTMAVYQLAGKKPDPETPRPTRWLGVLLLCGTLALGGCQGTPVEFCYDHPEYGRVCVVVGGKKYYEPSLTPEQRKEAEKFVEAEEKKKEATR